MTTDTEPTETGFRKAGLTDTGLTDTGLTDTGLTDTELTDTVLTDTELTELALSVGPDEHLTPDAVPLYDTDDLSGLLPLWYMPRVTRGLAGRSHLAVGVIIVASLLVVVASGFCVTYGILEIA